MERREYYSSSSSSSSRRGFKRGSLLSMTMTGPSHWCRLAWLVMLVVQLLHVDKVTASCSRGVTELWAYKNEGFEEFQDSYTKYITSSRKAECRWVIISSNDDWGVRLSFKPFEIKNSTSSKRGDCVEIYEGDETDDDAVIDRVCNKLPTTYKSEGRKLFVVYRRGNREGTRRIGFVYNAEDMDSTNVLLKIAGIVAAVITVLAIIYLILRHQPFKCWKKPTETTAAEGTADNQAERDRLTIQVAETGSNSGDRSGIITRATRRAHVPNGVSLVANADTGGGGNSGCDGNDGENESAAMNGNEDATVGDTTSLLDSDSGSLHTLNEPPPSYESLYLAEDGGIEPPQYTPPKHQVKNPPRRVHTFN